VSEQKRINWASFKPCGCMIAVASVSQDPQDKTLRAEVARWVRIGDDVRQVTDDEVRSSRWKCDVCKPPEKTFPLFGG
jgi:hypothetical protein